MFETVKCAGKVKIDNINLCSLPNFIVGETVISSELVVVPFLGTKPCWDARMMILRWCDDFLVSSLYKGFGIVAWSAIPRKFSTSCILHLRDWDDICIWMFSFFRNNPSSECYVKWLVQNWSETDPVLHEYSRVDLHESVILSFIKWVDRLRHSSISKVFENFCHRCSSSSE